MKSMNSSTLTKDPILRPWTVNLELEEKVNNVADLLDDVVIFTSPEKNAGAKGYSSIDKQPFDYLDYLRTQNGYQVKNDEEEDVQNEIEVPIEEIDNPASDDELNLNPASQDDISSGVAKPDDNITHNIELKKDLKRLQKISKLRKHESMKSVKFVPRSGPLVCNVSSAAYRDRYGRKMSTYVPRDVYHEKSKVQSKTRPESAKLRPNSANSNRKNVTYADYNPNPDTKNIIYSDLMSSDISFDNLKIEGTNLISSAKDDLNRDGNSSSAPNVLMEPENKTRLNLDRPTTTANLLRNAKSELLPSLSPKEKQSYHMDAQSSLKDIHSATPPEIPPFVPVQRPLSKQASTEYNVNARPSSNSKPNSKPNSSSRKKKVSLEEDSIHSRSKKYTLGALEKIQIASESGTTSTLFTRAKIKEIKSLRDQLMTTTGNFHIVFHPDASSEVSRQAYESLLENKMQARDTVDKIKADHTWPLLATPGFVESVGADHVFQSVCHASHTVDDKFENHYTSLDKSHYLQKNPVSTWANEAVKRHQKIFVSGGSFKV